MHARTLETLESSPVVCCIDSPGSWHVCGRRLLPHKSRISGVSAARDCQRRRYVLWLQGGHLVRWCHTVSILTYEFLLLLSLCLVSISILHLLVSVVNWHPDFRVRNFGSDIQICIYSNNNWNHKFYEAQTVLMSAAWRHLSVVTMIHDMSVWRSAATATGAICLVWLL